MGAELQILMATHNGVLYLKEQLDSLFAQSHRNFELIVSDDASTDGTLELLKEYPITLLSHKTPLGCKANFSHLLNYSSASYVAFSDQDDIWHPEKIAVTLKAIKQAEAQNPPGTPILVHTDLKVVSNSLEPLSTSFWTFAGLDPFHYSAFSSLLVQNCVTGCTLMINRPLADLVSQIPPEAKMHDWWIALTAAAFGKIVALPLQTISYRQHASNTLGAKRGGLKGQIIKFLQGNGLRALSQAREERKQQAKAFHTHYHAQLKQPHNEALLALIHADDRTRFKNIYEAFRLRLLRNGVASNIARLLLHNPF